MSDEDDNVVVLDVPTTLDLPTERILNEAKEWATETVIVIGEGEDGGIGISCSMTKASEILFALEIAKKIIMDAVE